VNTEPARRPYVSLPAVPPGRGGAAHQLVIAATRDLRAIAVSCTCLRGRGAEPIGVRRRWGGGEAFQAWLAHLAEGAAR
jgi:hypothetical protein